MGDILIALIVALAVVGLISFAFFLLLGRSKTAARQVVRRKIEALDEAKLLLSEGRYGLSVIKAFSSIELALRYTAESYAEYTTQMPSFELLNLLTTKGKLNKDLTSGAHFVRMLRNKAVHEKAEVSKYEATQAMEHTRMILSHLGFVTN